MLRFDKATDLSLLFKFILSVRFSNRFCDDQMFYYSQNYKYSLHSVL